MSKLLFPETIEAILLLNNRLDKIINLTTPKGE